MPIDTVKPAQSLAQELDSVVIRFAGDSGDGMQITGSQFTHTAALAGNDLATFPDFPAEIRAPAGTLPGVSGFQVNFGAIDIQTPGDRPDVLVAMNPAALKVNLGDLPRGGILIVNADAFEPKDLAKAGYEKNPLEDGSLESYRLFEVNLTTRTREALEGVDLSTRDKDRCKNFYALGMMYWLYSRSMETTDSWIAKKFAKNAKLADANLRVLHAGYNYCNTAGIFQNPYIVAPADLPSGVYRNIMGNSAICLGLVAAARQAKLPLFLGSYPITPASGILHELSRYKQYGVYTFQAEDEIAAIGAAIGAAYGGALGVTSTSGPGMCLKAEALGLAVMLELPLIVCNIQRGGPSTGLPTKTEQADLLMAIFGRHGECPLPVIAAQSPADCFAAAYEAVLIATKFMTPVILLSDGYIANGSEPWKLPKEADLPEIRVEFRTDPEGFKPYMRDPVTLARPWAVPGTPGLEHRIGGLEKKDIDGSVNYDPINHEHMMHLRAEKVARVVQEIPDLVVDGEASGRLLVVGWGSTYGAIRAAVQNVRKQGHSVSRIHLRNLNPFPANLEEVLRSFDQVLVPEINLGQLSFLLRGRFLVDAISLPKAQAQPFKVAEIESRITELLGAHAQGKVRK